MHSSKIFTGPERAISLADIIKRLNEIETKLKECCESVNKQDGVVHDHVRKFIDVLFPLTYGIIINMLHSMIDIMS